jgi:geranylgeranyl pyrophosphate synthase
LLSQYIQAASSDPDAAREAIRILDESGAAAYVQIEMEQNKSLALAALEKSRAQPPAADVLAEYVINPD